MTRFVLGALLLTGCAASPTEDTGSNGELHTYQTTGVVTVGAGGDDRTIRIDVNVPAGSSDCVRDVIASVSFADDERVFVMVTMTSARLDTHGHDCAEHQRRTATVTLPEPLGQRVLVVNNESTWLADGDGYRQCDELLGCRPPPDRCDQRWIGVPLLELDVPRDRQLNIERCQVPWASVIVSYRIGGCPPGGQDCSGTAVATRYFLHFSGEQWEVITGDDGVGGCTVVHETEPAYPEELCRDLPAT